MIDDVRHAREAALNDVKNTATLDELRAVDTEVLGKRGPLATLKTRLGGVPIDQRKTIGQVINEAIGAVHAAVEARRGELSAGAMLRRIADRRMDLTEVPP